MALNSSLFKLSSFKNAPLQWSPTFLAPGTSFEEDNLSMYQPTGGWGAVNSLGLIQEYYIYCLVSSAFLINILYFYASEVD